MAGYRNRTITGKFEELSEDGDLVYVTIRNPRTVPFQALQPRQVARDAAGQVIDQADAYMAGYEVIASLITDLHAYDATVLGDEQPLLTLPATADTVAKLPLEIQNWLGTEVNRAQNPTKTPDTPTP